MPPLTVLDTNVVFDWLLFADAGCALLREAIEGGALRWIATRAMRDECFHVLQRGTLDAWSPDPIAIAAAWDRHCTLVDPPPASARVNLPRCSDPNDQMFIDLAATWRVRWLFSKDRAVGKLAGRLKTVFDVDVLAPARWSAAAPVDAAPTR